MKRHLKKACYRSHVPVLELIFKKLKVRKIVEFGIGENSTIFFRNKGFDLLISIDNSREWLSRFTENKPGNHIIMLYEEDSSYEVDVLEDIDLTFVDGHPAESRIECANRNIPKSKVTVIHDTESRKIKLEKLVVPDEYTIFEFKPTHPEIALPETTMIIRDDLIDDEIKEFFK